MYGEIILQLICVFQRGIGMFVSGQRGIGMFISCHACRLTVTERPRYTVQ